ncbi:uncharacterized protein [Arachis hypogaea]|uniref:uncharacterized protein n=1 Tax=Arachis hypogaea TaxID=3818 RepID=UPI000DECE5EE
MYEKWEMHQTLPQEFVENITIDENGYPVYRRRDDGNTIMKLGIDLDNCYVIPYNRYLLMRYGAHINVEWHNQSRSIKYLFKDEHDEVSMYYDCRYISPCKAAWRIFGYNIHYRDPSVVRLGFHLPNEQPVVFRDDENSEDISRKASVKESMFLEWFEVNKSYPKARSLTYVEFPTKFVWKAKERKLFPRKSLAVIDLRLTDDELKELALIDIELILKGYHKSLTYFESCHTPSLTHAPLR